MSKGRWAVPGYKVCSTDDLGILTVTNALIGEVRRFVRPLSISFHVVTSRPIWVVSPRIVNSSNGLQCILDPDKSSIPHLDSAFTGRSFLFTVHYAYIPTTRIWQTSSVRSSDYDMQMLLQRFFDTRTRFYPLGV